jgi:hypothetical protein
MGFSCFNGDKCTSLRFLHTQENALFDRAESGTLITYYNTEGTKMRAITATIVLAALAGAAAASPFTYQGSLVENGQPANGLYDMTFQLADAEIFGFLLDSDTINNVEVVNGLFTVEVDFDEILMNHDSRWIAVVVEGTPLSPRTRLRPTPRAYNAVRANTAGTVEAPLFLSASNATINAHATSSTGTALLGWHTSSSGNAAGIHGRTNSTDSDAIGVLGEVTDTNPGIFSAGVRGINNGTGSAGIGVYGSHSGSGWGLYGFSPDGRGVSGSSPDGIGSYGTSRNGTGVFGTQTGSGTTGSLGTVDYGLEAYNTATQATGTAIYGEGGRVGVQGHGAPDGFGIDLTRIGVLGTSGGFSSGGDTFYGVYGFGINPIEGGQRTSYGVYGLAQVGNSSNTAYGVYGETVGPGGTQYAGYFAGNVHVLGTLSKSAGAFKIDHPLDPENKYLSHSFVESPDMMNIYNGVIVLDNNGNAVVTLPDYFESLNNSFRYQLTPIGASMPDLYISSEVSTNEFAIAGGVPGAKVSWEITGIRQDPSAISHPIIVEEDKQENHRGKYLDPEAYGFDDSVAIHPRPRPIEN